MNKHINKLSWSGMLGIEKKEHGLKQKPTSKDMPKMEMKEHGLKTPPSKATIMRMEKKEHIKNGKIVVGKGFKG
jgi:hypothetical protein